MATMAETTQITCPGKSCGGHCGGETVDAHGFGDFTAATVEVDPCSFLLGQGWVGVQLVEYKSRADYLLPPATTTTWRHRDGLVTFTV